MGKTIVFTHFTLPQDAQPVDFRPNEAKIARCCRDRIQMYARCPSVGLVYVFIAEGYQAVLGDDRPWEGLERERILRDLLEHAIQRGDPAGKVQIVGTREVTPTMARLSKAAALAGYARLGALLLGSGRHMYYDSPKVAEAILRLARAEKFGKEPIFRFDADVVVDESSVRQLLDYYARCSKRPYYFFSGGYRSPKPGSRTDWLLNSYPVRVAQFCSKAGGAGSLDIGMACRFLKDLRNIGGDPCRQVISGAGLCMSPDAIRALPPFANVGEQVIWIDDHLKRILHEDLGHFGRARQAHCRCHGPRFVQDRYPGGITAAVAHWHGNGYLERLVRGCLLDAVIQDRRPRRRGLVAQYVREFWDGWRPPKGFLETKLKCPLDRRLDDVINTWQAPRYLGSPVYDFAQRLAAARSSRGGVPYVAEVIDAVDTYFHLLEVWDQFVNLCRRVDRRIKANEWLFRKPV
jgi:hypothetical protein